MPSPGIAACVFAAAFALLLGFAAPAAEAQTSIDLVKNTGQTQVTSNPFFTKDFAQAFTTGSNTTGYKLTGLDIRLEQSSGTATTYTVAVVNDSAGSPGSTVVGTLTNPSSLPTSWSNARFTHATGFDLAADTTYWVRIDYASGPPPTSLVAVTTSNSEDSGAQAGWNIADSFFSRANDISQWASDTNGRALMIAIRGYAKSNPPEVTGVEISSTPSLDVDGDNTPETYGLGEKIQVQVTFDKNVTVTGTPRLKIKMDPNFGEFWANYESGSGTKVLTFAYTVVSPNVSPNGVAVLENTLELNGGTIKDADSVDANLAHDGLAHNASHKVNSGLQPATPETPKTPASQRPRFTSGVGPLRLEPGVAMNSVTLPAATGGGGAPYTYVLTSSPAGLAGLSFDATTRRLSGTPEAEGRWTFTYAATDANGAAAILSFRVTVGVALEEQQGVVKRTLAEVASRTIAGAVSNIGTRLGDAAPTPGMTIAGETVRFGASSRPADGWRNSAACPPDAWGRAFETVAPGCAPRAGSRGVHTGALLPASAFSWTLGAAPGDKESENRLHPLAPRWAVWGRGDFGSFSGRPDDISSYSGETRTGWLGVDAREAPRGSSGGSARPGRWVAGLAVSRGTSETDYVLDGEEGRIETALTALWPYGRWTFANGLELRGMLGAGRGEARHETDDGETREKSRLRMWTGSAGLRRPLPPVAGIDLAARGDVSLARMQTAKGGGDQEQAVDGILADAWRVRGGIEASRLIPFDDGSSLTPFVETAARRDGGDGVTGTGLEVAGGLRVAAPRFQVEARGRWLAAHSEDGAEERGVSLTARAGPGAHGRGLSVVLSPRWGQPAGEANKLWQDELPKGGGADAAGRMEGEVGYGFGHFGGRVTGTPNVGFGASDDTRDYRIGWRLTPAAGGYFQVNVDATRRESANANEPPAHGAMLTGAIRW